ncbi:MAG: hypothetical protein DHS20C18_49890 [Saprospiraceae bacterium]|nr:MAG: hypothetical protein DHS20C18_49890 [Saprospiraceae bacterium]
MVYLAALICMPFLGYTNTSPLIVEVNLTATPVSCFGGLDGQIDATVTEGVPPYVYLWSNGETNEDLSNMPAGTYSLTVTDAEDMVAVETVNITEPSAMVLNPIITNSTCFGLNDGSIYLEVTGGEMPYVFNWLNGFVGQFQSNLAAGVHGVFVTDGNGCTVEQDIVITSGASNMEATFVVQNIICLTPGSIDLTVNGGTPPYTYLWSTANTQEDLTGLTEPGDYLVTITDANGCQAIAEAFLFNDSLEPQVSDFSCNDNDTPSDPVDDVFYFQVMVPVGNSDGWTSTNGYSGTYGVPTTFGPFLIQDGPVNFTLIDNGNDVCTRILTVEPPFSSCDAFCEVSPSILEYSCDDNGTPGVFTDDLFSFSLLVEGNNASAGWTANDPNNSSGVYGVPTTLGPYAISDGVFGMDIVDNENPNCGLAIVVTPPNDCVCDFFPVGVTISGILELECETGASTTLSVNVDGGVPPYIYIWSVGATTPFIEISEGGNYSITVIDNNGCEAVDTVTIPINSSLIADAGPDQVLSCINATVTLDASNSVGDNLIYMWTGPNGFISNGPVINVTQAGPYLLRIHEDGDDTCTDSDVVIVVEDILGNVELTSNLINCDSARLYYTLPLGTASPTWTYPNNDISNENSIGTTQSGYHVLSLINEENGCSITDSILINFDPNQCATIEGRLVQDTSLNCMPDADEPGLSGWLIVIESGTDVFYAVSQADGSYTQRVPLGDYEVYPIPISTLWLSCENTYPVSLNTAGETANQDMAVEELEPCPELTVEVTLPILRRCWDRSISVQYCNYGTVAAEDAYVTVTLDDFFDYLSSSIPVASQDGNTFTFELGEIAVNDCDIFIINVNTSCDAALGQSLCTEAKIFPNDPCSPPDVNWSGSSLRVTGECQGNEVVFIIENIGADMVDASNFIVIEDGVMLMVIPDTVQLNAGDTYEFPLPANGSTYRMEVDQVNLHPGMSHPTAIVEGCGTNEQGEFSTGFVNQFSMDDEDEFIDIDCREIIGSYDPNDKHGFPRGYGEEHYIKPGTGLEYLINFQNTGNDTAFLVVLRDTLSPFLDIRTLRPGASSHAYTWDIEDGKVLVFTFDNILLPDSTTNEAASHGHIEYHIDQLDDLPLETLIENKVAIYFDVNEPVITNTTFHRLGEDYVEVITTSTSVVNPLVKVLAFPNPMVHQTRFVLEGWTNQDFTFTLTDTHGQTIFQENFRHNIFDFSKGKLSPGIYFYQIINSHGEAVNGKLIIQ